MYENLSPSLKMKVFKEEIGDERKIIRIVFQNLEFYFKSLTQNEYQNLLAVSENDYDLEDNICQTALIYPENFVFKETGFSGISKNFSKIILENSLFMNVNEYKNVYMKYKNQMNDFKNRCIAIIKSQFQEFTFEEMEEWPLEKIFKYVTRAEYIYNISRPEEEQINLELNNDFEEVEERDKEEIYNEMLENGIDPVIYESQNIIYNKKHLKEDLFIGGSAWKNEEIVNEIRRQLEKTST